MKELRFTKMSGNGNDFIVIDNYKGKIKLSAKEIAALCANRFSIGADGLILLNKPSKGFDFTMKFYNNNGKEADMCGNGARCISRFSYLKGYSGTTVKFMANDGPHTAQVKPNGEVKLGMTDPFDIKKAVTAGGVEGAFMNTGVPHFVVPVKDIKKVDVAKTGRMLRFHRVFGPKGTNVNFVQKTGKNSFAIRTYERGVEAETYACGTGATAAGIALYLNGVAKSPVTLFAKGGKLTIYFKDNGGIINDVFLEGNARVVAEGMAGPEALKW